MAAAERVFELAIALMDEQSLSGAYNTGDNADFRNRTLPLIALLGTELSMAAKPLPREAFRAPESFSDEIDLPEALALTALPCALAQLLTAESAPEFSELMRRKYLDTLELYRLTHGEQSFEIEDVYA